MYKSFYHAGDIGDVIYSLIVVKQMGGGDVWFGPRHTLGERYAPRAGIDKLAYVRLTTLVGQQPYVDRVRWTPQPPFVMNDLNRFRYFWRGDFSNRFGNKPGSVSLQKMHLAAFNIPDVDEREPWLTAAKRREAPVVFARSPRYHNYKFPWRQVIEKYSTKAVFVGLKDEYDAFVAEFPSARDIKWVETPLLWQLACIVNACDLFVGNQSAPYAIAEGLKVNTIQETRIDAAHDAGADCIFNRPNAQFARDDKVTLPDI